MIIDLHVHTVHGSGDSNLSPEQLVEEAARIGLDGACRTEHNRTWDARDLQEFVRDHNHVLLMRAMEVETNMGHITVFGLDGYVPGIWNLEELRRVADKEGAFIVTAHPFRGLFNPSLTNLLFKEDAHPPATVEEAARHPVFGLVDAIEVANGGNPEEENAFALEVARYLGKPAVGGSDCHSTNGLGACVTVFPRPIGSEQKFMEALRAGDYYPATGLRTGHVQPFGVAQ